MELRAGDAESRAEMHAADLADLSRTIQSLEDRLRSSATAADDAAELKRRLAEAEADRDELLLLVGELDEFNESHAVAAPPLSPADADDEVVR